MVSAEIQRPISGSERRTVKSLIAERPMLTTLRVGYHLRNEEEALDLLDVLNKYVPQRMYTGLAGSRRAGIIVHSERRLTLKYQRDMSPETISGIRREWPQVAATLDGRLPLQLPTVRHPKIANRPAGDFFYDIDVSVVPAQFDGEAVYETEKGLRSGTKIEVFIVPVRSLLAGDHPFYTSVFYNSERLPYPYTSPRKRINFDNIFRGWRKKSTTIPA